MSGLAGWVDFGRDLAGSEAIVHGMTEAMVHRGPDGKGTWISRNAALGHRSLATSARSAADQPAVIGTGDEQVACACAGDVYNAPELLRDLQSRARAVRTDSVAELLAQAYLLWGDDFIARVNGVFGFAIWDGRSRTLLLGRDRIGVKPLYYFEYPGGILFASEPKGIIANPRFQARLDLEMLPIVLQPRLALPGETPLVGLREVPPAHLLRFSASGLTSRRYWQLISEPHRDSFEDSARHVRELLEDAVRGQLDVAVPMGAMLSGGLDSTSVAALAARATSEPLHTFCVELAGSPERFTPSELRPDIDAPYAAAAAEFLGTRHSTFTASMSSLLDAVPATRQARDLPGWGQFDASMYLLFQQMRRTCGAALSGEAADEFFGGYPYFFKPEIIAGTGFPWLFDGPRLAGLLAPDIVAVIDPAQDEKARYSQLMASMPRLPGEDPQDARMRELLFLGMAGPLAVILDRKERMSMAVGLDVRIPFCDHRLVQYVWNVPWHLKRTGGVKGLLKAAMADILPPSTLQRRKSAYPHVQNPLYEQAIVREATLIANDRSSPVAALFDTPRLNDLIRQISANEIRSELPGGSSQAALLIPLIEMRHWIDSYHVSLA